MIELWFGSLLEIVLFIFLIFVLIVYLQNTMETIWGDPLDPCDNQTKCDEHLEELIEGIDEALLEDNPENSSSEDVGFLINEDDPKSTNIDKANFKNTTSELLNYENTSTDDSIDEDFMICNQKNTTSSNEDLIYDIDNLECAISDNRKLICDTASDDEELRLNKNYSESTTPESEIFNEDVSSKIATEKVCFDRSENTTSAIDIEESHKLQALGLLIFENTVENFDLTTNNEDNKNYIISIPKFTFISENEDSYIKIVDFSNKMSRVYDVNGDSFVGDERLCRHDNDEVAEYQLFRMDKTAKDDYEDMTTTLDMHIQTLPQGVIINSNVFLWDAQWHTMALVDMKLFRCAVCQVYCDRLTCEDHVKTASHIRNLDKYKPLKRFDLGIVRKINVDLHCGVCNIIFDIIDYKTHENSKTHEESLLTAINKVCDLMFDSNIHSPYAQKNFLSGYRNLSSSERSELNSDRNVSCLNRNMLSPNRNMLIPDRNVSTSERMFMNTGEFHFDANAINNNINVYEEFSEEEEENEEYEIEEYNTPCQGISYASMASKPTIQLPKFLKIDLGTKEVRVKFESWHMITRMELNRFYCMVCSKKDHIRFKSQHCIGCEHVERLSKCTIVRAFEDYLIRKVDDKLYHCGHCNNLQYQNQMEDHIEFAHPKKHRNYVETINLQKPVKKTKTTDKSNKPVIEPKKTESDKSAIVNKNLEYDRCKMQPPKLDPQFDIFGDIPLTPFDCTLRIPALNFNLIIKKDDGYYCAICDKVCANVKGHVEEMEHVELMTMTPFIKPFLNNLTRAVRGMLHCSLCNKLFPVSEVYDHNIAQPHTTALATAMGMKKSQKPENTKRVTILSLDKDHNLTFNLPPKVPAKNLQEVPKENIKPSSFNNMEKVTPQKANKPDIVQETSNLGESCGEKSIYDAASVQAKLRAYSDKKQTNKHNIGNMLKMGQSAQNQFNTAQNIPQVGLNLPNPGQYLPNAGRNSPVAGQNLPAPGQNLLNTGQTLPSFIQNLPNAGQTLPNYAQNQPKSPCRQNINTQSVKSIPPMFNSMFPQLPPVNTQNLRNQFMGPLTYNYNARPSVSPFPNVTPIHSPKLLSPGIPAQREKSPYNQEMERKTLIITDKNDTGNVSKTRTDSRRESENSRTGSDNYRRGSDSSRPSSDNFRLGSDCKSIDLSDNIESDSQSDDEYKDFDEQEMVFVKLKTAYFKITNLSYHTLVFLDNGLRYCFVCSSMVPTSQQHQHVESRKHMDFLSDNKFLDKYGMQLFRQMYLMYHCAICNELMTRKEIKLHLDWTGHVENYNTAHLILSKKNRKELKSGLKEYIVETQKEAIFHNVNEPNYHIRAAYQIVPSLDVNKDAPESRPAKSGSVKKNKMVIQNNAVMKISFYHWHGIITSKNVTKCVICQMEIKLDEVLEHVDTEYHAVGLGKTFEKTYYPALIRKINECTVNCMTCNLELPNNEYMIHEHVSGRKHNKNHETILGETSRSDSYADCYEDYLNI